jgi:hypothetical protein
VRYSVWSVMMGNRFDNETIYAPQSKQIRSDFRMRCSDHLLLRLYLATSGGPRQFERRAKLMWRLTSQDQFSDIAKKSGNDADKNTILTRLRERKKEFESSLVDTLLDLQPDGAPKQSRKVLTSGLRTGMILDQEIKNLKGVVLVAKGQEVTSTLIMRLENHASAGAIDREVMAYVPF